MYDNSVSFTTYYVGTPCRLPLEQREHRFTAVVISSNQPAAQFALFSVSTYSYYSM